MDLNSFVARYRPYLAIVAAIVALVAFMPSDGDGEQAATAGGASGLPAGGASGASGTGATVTSIDPVTGAITQVPVGSISGGVTSGGGSASAGSTAGASGGAAGSPAVPVAAAGALENPECDPATGRVRLPSLFAPPCVPAFSGDNGGATYQGVTADTIKVVLFRPEADPAVDAALTAAGASNTREEQLATILGYVEIFNEHLETYGRTVEIVVRDGSGPADDDAVGRADALAIAAEDQPFAVWGAPNDAFVAELAARGILCICTASKPQEYYEQFAPYVGYTSLMSSTQGYVHRAEYLGKRLAGRKAVHAGTRDGLPMNVEDRKFGLLYYDTPDGSYASGVEFFQRELLEKYGVRMTEVLAYPSDLAESAERARPLIQRLKGAGVTTVLFSGDFINPATYTREATNQAYFPEWIITGSLLTDTTIFARTYDQAQWQRAFGLSFLVARTPDEFNNAYRLWKWHFGDAEIPAENQFKTIYPTPSTFFTGVHLAGPNLTVESWQAGLFSYPVTGLGMTSAGTVSYGNHGLWPFTDYTALDDVVEIWWDVTATGADEVGNTAAGMYRYVDFGRRYMPGAHPSTDPVVFTSPETAPAFSDAPPPGEEPPDYEHPAHG